MIRRPARPTCDNGSFVSVDSSRHTTLSRAPTRTAVVTLRSPGESPISFARDIRIDVMTDPGWDRPDMKRSRQRFLLLVISRCPCMLPNVLGPGFDEELFDKSRWIFRVLVDAPRRRTVAPTCRPTGVHEFEERISIGGINLVFDGHHHGTGFGFCRGNDAFDGRPVAGGAQINVFDAAHWKQRSEQDANASPPAAMRSAVGTLVTVAIVPQIIPPAAVPP